MCTCDRARATTLVLRWFGYYVHLGWHGDADDDTMWDYPGWNACMTGWGGNDTLHGRDGDDILKGRSGNDVLNGGEGDDLLGRRPRG